MAEAQPGDDIADEAARNTLALNPLLAIRPQDLLDAATRTARALLSQPQLLLGQASGMAAELVKIATGRSEIEADPRDRRFADPAWRTSAVHKAMLRAYLAWGESVAELVAKTELNDTDAARARLLSSILVDALAPSNNPLLNPTAVKTFVDTGGRSAVDGLLHFLEDMAENGGLPSSVDASGFELGRNVATAPGAVVFRNEVLELVQYAPTTEQIHRRPLVIVPPQINKYYSVDLSPEKSMIKYLTEHGIQPFCISWRNPTPKQADWGLDTYVTAVDAAVEAAQAITGSDTVNMMGSCSGGITLSTYLAWLAGQDLDKVHSVVLAVCVLDTEAETDSDFAALATPETLAAAKLVSKQKGVLDGRELAKMFAWMRPNDLIWNYWVNNYLLGKKPPAFDVLFWNADTTRLPARLHADYIDLGSTNPFVHADALTIGGVPIDLAKVDVPTYVIAGTTDHITPWKIVYRTARLYGENTTFVLSNSGHLQSLLNAPGNPKSWFRKGVADVEDPEQWAAKTEKSAGSWWPDWATMLQERSDELVAAPATLGDEVHVPLAQAPGTYVLEP